MEKKLKTVDVLGVNFTKITLNKTVNEISKIIESKKPHYLCTPNPEMILESLKDDSFKKILNDAYINIPDGIGILWASTVVKWKSRLKALLSLPILIIYPRVFKKHLNERITGVDLFLEICKKSPELKSSIFLLGASPGVAEKVKSKLEKRINNIKIVGTYAGSPSPEDETRIIELINKLEPEILFVAYGAPAQEKWISKNLKRLESVKVAVGIGGAFDFIAGKRKRAPKWMQKLGIEWLFRLIQEPKRIKRIINAVIVFPYKVITKMK